MNTKSEIPLIIFGVGFSLKSEKNRAWLVSSVKTYLRFGIKKIILVADEAVNGEEYNFIKEHGEICIINKSLDFSDSIKKFFDLRPSINRCLILDFFTQILDIKLIETGIRINSNIVCFGISPYEITTSEIAFATVDSEGYISGWVENYSTLQQENVFGVLGAFIINRSIVTSKFSLLSLDQHERRDLVRCKKSQIKINSIRSKSEKISIFCDLDGTLVEHTNDPVRFPKLKLLPGTRDFSDWIRFNKHELIICTARKKDPNLKSKLVKLKIPVARLLFNLSSGSRVLINDIKPRTIRKQAATSISIERDLGVLGLPDTISRSLRGEKVVRDISGASGARSWIVDEGGRLFVKKFALQNDGAETITALERQYGDFVHYSRLFSGLVPAPIKAQFSPEAASFYIDYYQCLEPNYSNIQQVLANSIYIVTELKDKFYNKKIKRDVLAELKSCYKEKVEPRLLWIKAEYLLEENVPCKLQIAFKRLENNFCQVQMELDKFDQILMNCGNTHGDLTLENVLFLSDGTIKLIDIQAPPILGSCYASDFGKLLQSVLSGYEQWGKLTDDQLTNRFNKVLGLLEYQKLLLLFAEIGGLNESQAEKTALIYLSYHLVRMCPFQNKIGKDRVAKAIILADLVLLRVRLL